MTEETTAPVDENSPDSILDVFSMEFEGSKEETPATTESSTAPTDTPNEAPATEEKSEPEEEPSSQVEETTPGTGTERGTKEELPNRKEPSVAQAPSSDALLAEALKAINALSAKSEKPSAQEKDSASKPEEDVDAKVFSPKKFEDYTFNISPKLYNGLFNSESTDEDRIACLQAYASGIATTVHNKIMEELGAWTKKQFSFVPEAVNYIIEQRESRISSQRSLREDFYSSFPELNKPELLPLIKATIEAVQKETGAKSWNGNFKTLVGNRVKGILGAYAQAGKPVPTAPKTTPPASSPKPQINSVSDPNSPEAILDVFNSDF